MDRELEVLAKEYFIHKVIGSYGFEKTPSERLMLYDRTAGQMVHKYGEFYNTEVLMNPPAKNAFYYPSRIIVECKCCRETLALAFAKSILSIKSSIMERISVGAPSGSDIAYSVQNSPRAAGSNYEVMFATLDLFSNTLVSFACANKIPLLSLYNNRMIAKVLDCARMLEGAVTKCGEAYQTLIKYLKAEITLKQLKSGLVSAGCHQELSEIEKFIQRTDFAAMNVSMDLFGKGKIMYLIWI